MPGFSLLSTRSRTVARGLVAAALLRRCPRGRARQDLLSTTVSAGSSAHRQCAELALSPARPAWCRGRWRPR